jgi:hypothetical protein
MRFPYISFYAFFSYDFVFEASHVPPLQVLDTFFRLQLDVRRALANLFSARLGALLPSPK